MPKHGKVDDKEHHGGNTWAGGTGGADTAGMGGKGGPYRLDKGNDVYQISEEEKKNVSEESLAAAREMAKEELAKRLAEIDMSEHQVTSSPAAAPMLSAHLTAVCISGRSLPKLAGSGL